MEKKILVQKVNRSLNNFIHWLQSNGYKSYDPYDLWATKYGIMSRKIYYRNKYIGIPLVLPIVVLDIIAPRVRRFIVTPQSYAIADANICLAFIHLYEVTKNDKYLDEAKKIADYLFSTSIKNYSGYCWGYPFDWQNCNAFWKAGIPFVTVTPYCFNAFLKLYMVTSNTKYLDIAYSISKFIFYDIKEEKIADNICSCSYSPFDHTRVINAASYRAQVLMEASCIFNNPEFESAAWRNINFILYAQNQNGSWNYEYENSQNNFIDNFHTCIVLKNLVNIYNRTKSPQIFEAIRKGYEFYRLNLFDKENNPLHFAKNNRMQIVKNDLYDFAEGIVVNAQLKNLIDGTFDFSILLANKLMDEWQLSDGHFLTRKYKFGITNTMPYLRWAQSQVFYALTLIQKMMDE